MSRLAHVAINAARERHPGIELVLKTFDATKEVSAPQLALARFEAQRLERNCYFDVEAGLVNDAFGFHQQVDAEVFTASFGHDAVALNSEWIEKDFERFSFVVEGVE